MCMTFSPIFAGADSSIKRPTMPHLPAWLNDDSRTLYAGFDPTADSLHVGHLCR